MGFVLIPEVYLGEKIIKIWSYLEVFSFIVS